MCCCRTDTAVVMRDTPDVRCAAVAGLVRLLWPAGLAVADTLLRAARHDVLVQLLVRALQVRRRRWEQQAEFSGFGYSGVVGRHGHTRCSDARPMPGSSCTAVGVVQATAATGSDAGCAAAGLQATPLTPFPPPHCFARP